MLTYLLNTPKSGESQLEAHRSRLIRGLEAIRLKVGKPRVDL